MPVSDPIERSITWNQASEEVWLKYKDSTLLGRLNEAPYPDHRDFNDTLQLSVAYLNMGDPNQRFLLPDGSRARVAPGSHNLICRFLTSGNYAHVLCINEASNLRNEATSQLFKDTDITAVFSNEDSDLAILARRPGKLRILHEFSRPNTLRWMAAEVEFVDNKEALQSRTSGENAETDIHISRAGYHKIRVIVMHTDDKAARDDKGMRRVRGELNSMLNFIAARKVDIVGGDMNGAAQIAF